MKRLGIAVVALLLAAAPASAQRGGGHGGGFHGGGGGFHGGVGGGFHGGGGFRGGFGYRGGFYGPRYGFGFGCCGGFYAPYYDPFWSPYYYGAPYYPYPDYDYGYDAPPPPPPPEQGYNAPPPPQQEQQSPWHVTQREGETDYELPDSVLFALDSAHVSRDADQVLQEIADAAHDSPRADIVVEGHTDTSGTHEHNQALSDARARAVADVLVRLGVERGRIRTEGMGESGLAVQTGDGVREARNRRVIIRVIGANLTSRYQERGPDYPPN
jgi:outer membrane protein OmpA-like peptidoglycan-associated protein